MYIKIKVRSTHSNRKDKDNIKIDYIIEEFDRYSQSQKVIKSINICNNKVT